MHMQGQTVAPDHACSFRPKLAQQSMAGGAYYMPDKVLEQHTCA